MTDRSIVCRFEIVGFHRWVDAPDEVKYLRERHRHKFYFEVKKLVTWTDREIEFIGYGEQMKKFIYDYFEPVPGGVEFGTLSCEMIAEILIVEAGCSSACVYEDNENGGCVEG